MLAVRREAISSTDDFGTVHDRLAKLGTELLVDTLDQVAAGALAAEPQPEAGATYARKIDRSELEVDWNRDAEEIACAVRAFRPAPGLGASVGGRRFKIWAGEVVERMQADAPGDILLADRTGIVVACGRAAYRITELQRSGGRRMKVHEYLRGQPHGPASHGEIVPDAGD
jgi:methionyl-tRNA formyltransferase